MIVIINNYVYDVYFYNWILINLLKIFFYNVSYLYFYFFLIWLGMINKGIELIIVMNVGKEFVLKLEIIWEFNGVGFVFIR